MPTNVKTCPITTRRRVQTKIEGQSMTRQSHKAECDINNIVAKYRKDGVVKHLAKHGGMYEDVTGADFREWMNKLVNAQAMFDELPSHIRNKFGNDPAAFLDYVQNPDNLEEMREIGLARGTAENPADSQLLSPNTPPMKETQTVTSAGEEAPADGSVNTTATT